jgi:hypothetical protein
MTCTSLELEEQLSSAFRLGGIFEDRSAKHFRKNGSFHGHNHSVLFSDDANDPPPLTSFYEETKKKRREKDAGESFISPQVKASHRRSEQQKLSK